MSQEGVRKFAIGGSVSDIGMLERAAMGVRPRYSQAEKDWIAAREAEYADYNKSVDAYNQQVSDYQKLVDAYNESIKPYQAEYDQYMAAVDAHNKAVEAYRQSLFLGKDDDIRTYKKSGPIKGSWAGVVRDPDTGITYSPGSYYATLGDDSFTFVARQAPINTVDLTMQRFGKGGGQIRYIDPRTGAVVATSTSPVMGKDFMISGGKLYEFAPTPGEFTAKPPGEPPPAFTGVQPTAPKNVPYTEDQVKQYVDTAKARAQSSASSRALGLRAVSDPSQYNLSGLSVGLPFADGGEVSNGEFIRKRQSGSPPVGEVSTEDFIEQMTVGTRPTDQEADPNVVKDIVRGVQYTPFDVLGAPVDIATMVMRPFGYNVEKPVGGSDWFIEQAAKRGLAQPSTGSGAELLGRIAGGVTTPAAAKGVGKVAAKTEDFISGQLDTAAKKVEERSLAKLREQTGNPNLSAKEVYDAMFAAQAPGVPVVKPKGGNVVIQDIQKSLNNLRPKVTVPGEKNLPPSQLYASEVAAQLKEQIARNKQEGYPTGYAERLLEDVEPKAALDNWIQTKLSKYIRSDMGSEGDPVRKLAEEMSTKVQADYGAGLKRIAKMKDDIAKAKAAGKNTGASEAELAAEIDKVENAYRQTSMLPVSIGPYTHPAKRTGENREMAGFSPFPISKTSLGKEWEEIADREFYLHKAGDLVKADSPMLKENPWIANLNPEEIVYTAPHVDEMHMITHTLDELRNALSEVRLPPRLRLKPEDMQQLGIEKAFRLVNDINDWRLEQRIALNLEEAKRAAVTVKQYPDAPGGLQWQELKAPTYTELPPGYAVEQLDYNTAVLKGPDGKSLTYFDDIASGNRDVQKEALSFLAKNDLERALKYEGSTMRHCVGGYCDDVWSGNTRIYSLRDSKGEPHVTIETAPASTGRLEPMAFYQNYAPESLITKVKEARAADPTISSNQMIKLIRNSDEYKNYLTPSPDRILQIKGKANQKPTEKYIPFVQDFVASRPWFEIGDLKNTDLVSLKPMLLKNAQDRGFNPKVFTTVGDLTYVTKEEFNRLADLFGGMNKYAAGGEVTNFIRAHA